MHRTHPIASSRVIEGIKSDRDSNGVKVMRIRMIVSMLVSGLFAFSSFASGQNSFGKGGSETQPLKEVTPGPGWKTCSRCENKKQFEAANREYRVDGHPFDPHDLSGVWGNKGLELDTDTVPPMTPYGQKLYESTR